MGREKFAGINKFKTDKKNKNIKVLSVYSINNIWLLEKEIK